MKAKVKRIMEFYNRLPAREKAQFVTAMVLTCISIMVFPVLAWFSSQKKVETMSYVNDPPKLSLASGYKDSVVCFELKNINVWRDSDGPGEQDFVFSVETGKATAYDLQLAHTTNIPFTYEIYRIKQDENGTIKYKVQEGTEKGQVKKYSIMTGNIPDGDLSIPQDISLRYVNPANANAQRKIGSESVLASVDPSRKNYSTGDDYNKFVEPLYSVARHIQTNRLSVDGSDERDYFILRVKWNVKKNAEGNQYWDYAFNNKETDIIYITVKESQTTGSTP